MYGEYAGFRLLHKSLFRTVFTDFASRVAENVLGRLTVRRPEFVLDKAGALFAAAEELSYLPHCANERVSVDLDKQQPEDENASVSPVGMMGTLGAILTDSADALMRVANAYKKERFPAGPAFASLKVCDSKDSILVQAADVLANFGINYVKSSLRSEQSDLTKTEAAKARIFESIVGSQSNPSGSNFRLNTERNVLMGTPNDILRFKVTAFQEAKTLVNS